jgi:hypothetical protein
VVVRALVILAVMFAALLLFAASQPNYICRATLAHNRGSAGEDISADQ